MTIYSNYCTSIDRLEHALNRKLSTSIKNLQLFADLTGDETMKFYAVSCHYYRKEACISCILVRQINHENWNKLEEKFNELLEKMRLYSINFPICEKYVYEIINNVIKYKKLASDVHIEFNKARANKVKDN
jgi:ribosomal protein S26